MYNRHYCTIIGLITSCRMCLFSYAFLYCKIWQLITYNPSILGKKPFFFGYGCSFAAFFFFYRYYKIKLHSDLASIALNFLFPYTAFADRDILVWTWECTPWVIFVVFKAIFTWRYEKYIFIIFYSSLVHIELVYSNSFICQYCSLKHTISIILLRKPAPTPIKLS